MAAKAPANDREHLLKLINLVEEQHDLDKLLDAATNFSDWTVLSNDEKREIQRHSCKQRRLSRLVTFIIENRRAARFANFILRYNAPIQAAALAILNRPTVNVASSEMRPTVAAPISTSPEKIFQQPAGEKSSATATSSPMELDTTESPGACSDSMDTDLKENLYDNLSNSSQESPDFGYYSGSSKDFQSQNHSDGNGGGCPLNFFQSPQQNLKVIQKNQRSRQRDLKRSDITKHQHNFHFHQPTVVVNQVHYHVSPKSDLEQPATPQWLRPVMDHCPDIIQTLNMEMLTPHLLQNGLLAHSEYQQLDALDTSWKQAKHFLLNVLPTKGEGGFKLFLKCLEEETEHSGHQDLFGILKILDFSTVKSNTN